MLKIALFILLVVGIGGCALENVKPYTDMQNTYWKLISLNGQEVEVFDNNPELHFIISEEQIKGSDGCNRFFMPVKIAENKIEVGHGGSTKMMCAEGMEQSQKYMDALYESTSWQIDEDILKISKGNEEIAVFKATYF